MKTQKIIVSALIGLLLSSVAAGLAAEPSAHDTTAKIGIEAGYPSAVTAGYRFSKDFEANILFGNYWSYEFSVGANGLFRLTSLMIGDDPFPLSIGPEVLVRVGGASVGLDAVALVRLENTMRPAPLNFFIEAGLGLSILPAIGFTGTGAVGVRFVFDHPSVRTES